MNDKIFYLFGPPAKREKNEKDALVSTLEDIFGRIRPNERLYDRAALKIIKLLGYEGAAYRCNERDIIYGLPGKSGRFYLYGEVNTESLEAKVYIVVSNAVWRKVLSHTLCYCDREVELLPDESSVTYVREHDETVRMESVAELNGTALTDIGTAGVVALVSRGLDRHEKQVSEQFELTEGESENLKEILRLAGRISGIIAER